MAEKRFEVVHYQTFVDEIPIPTTYSCKVIDRETGNVGYGNSTTPEAAEKAAWEDLRSKQGPFPSEIRSSSSGK